MTDAHPSPAPVAPNPGARRLASIARGEAPSPVYRSLEGGLGAAWRVSRLAGATIDVVRVPGGFKLEPAPADDADKRERVARVRALSES